MITYYLTRSMAYRVGVSHTRLTDAIRDGRVALPDARTDSGKALWSESDVPRVKAVFAKPVADAPR